MDEVVNAAFEPTEAMQRKHRSGDDGDVAGSRHARAQQVVVQPFDPRQHHRDVEVSFGVDSRGGAEATPKVGIITQASDVVSKFVEAARQQSGLPSKMMSGVPPVFMAAIGTPSALASSRTRLNDSGPRDGKSSIDACASHAVAVR